MPEFNNNQKQELLTRAKFLFDKGYRFERENEFCIHLINDIIRFTIYSGRYSDKPDIVVRFLAQNETFGLGWISFIIDKERNINQDNVMETLHYMLDFLEKHYDEILDINFCHDIDKKISKFIQENVKSPIGFPSN